MSPAHPLGLRIASKKLNAPFIGVSQYYFYNQLKQNIVIGKNTKLLSKQLVMPVGQVAHLKSRFENSVRMSEIAYPRTLPTNILLKAKQLFDSQYVLSRQRLLNITIHYAAQFQQQFEKNYSYFTSRVSSALYFGMPFKGKSNPINQQRKKQTFTRPRFLFALSKRLPQRIIKTGAKETTIRLKQKKNVADQLVVKNINPYFILSCLVVKRNWGISHNCYQGNLADKSRFVGLTEKTGICINKPFKSLKTKPIQSFTIPVIYAFIYHFLNFKSVYKKENQPDKFNKKSTQKVKSIYLTTGLSLSKTPKHCFGRLSVQQELYAGPTLECTQGTSSAILLGFLSQLSPTNRALYQYSRFNKDPFLSFLSLYPSAIVSACLAKEISQKQKCAYINPAPVDKINISANAHSRVISYAICAHSNFTTLHFKNISKKFTRQIENFRNNIALLTPLRTLIHRNFMEPTAIHYISSLDNRIAKTYCSKFLKNSLFVRTSKDYLRSNYMRSRQGLVRLKDAVLFEFAYAKSSLIPFDLEKTNSLIQQLLETGRTKLWLRKISSIRL